MLSFFASVCAKYHFINYYSIFPLNCFLEGLMWWLWRTDGKCPQFTLVTGKMATHINQKDLFQEGRHLCEMKTPYHPLIQVSLCHSPISQHTYNQPRKPGQAASMHRWPQPSNQRPFRKPHKENTYKQDASSEKRCYRKRRKKTKTKKRFPVV